MQSDQGIKSIGTNKIRIDSYVDGSKELDNLRKRNLEKYGNEEGLSPEWCFEKYGSWKNVILKSYSPNT